MPKELIIVESPTKARTLSRFLGEGYAIQASMGHVRDLPKAKLGVDVEKDFEPQYVIPRDKRKTVEQLKVEAEKADEIILATDPDREGEAIAWHISQLTDGRRKNSKFKRIVFHEITKEAIEEALKRPRGIDLKLVDAQVARRVLDRLVGYKLSPILWKKVKRGLSAGRVQSVAVRLIVEREREIEKFVPDEYWSIEAKLRKEKSTEDFISSLVEKEGKKIEINTVQEATETVKKLESKNTIWKVSDVSQKDVRRSPYPPFTTSTLTQTAANAFGYTSKKTMKLAQDLYEEGLITYHRTDSFNLAQGAVVAARNYIKQTFGDKFLPLKARIYKTKSKGAQEAHEAVRPTNVELVGEKINILTKDHQKLYDLIWKRFVACQMVEAVYDQVSLDIEAKASVNYLFKASGSIVKFPGWKRVYGVISEEDEEEKKVPLLSIGDLLELLSLNPNQHFTQPPPRYTEASLIKTLEEMGIGRPSTYAPIISTIQDRRYVILEERKFKPTPLGEATSDFLVKNFAQEVDYNFTANMESELDEIANGRRKWVEIISKFYSPFEKHLELVSEEADRVKVKPEVTDEKCPEGHPLVVRYSRFGKFLACEKYPEHKFTKHFESEEFKTKEAQLRELNMKCPKSGDSVVLRQTKRGRIFYGCGGYPKCKWAAWKLPEEITSPQTQAS